MADQFDGTAEQVLAQLMDLVGAKARVSLERIKAACDRIEAMRGLMNYSRVAAVTVERKRSIIAVPLSGGQAR
ncbi:hypothetical protein [Burkholderia stabilis]|uniref:hypothetical protein n=1 Tax=Burkholderia stabilis TaxID=95485 RepID=UPI001588DF18|nr:hypothetical protein [Burkholderia stabilis]